MRILQGESVNMTGSLLVALPSLLDPHFRRSILFLIRHDPSEGAMGVILNRPTKSLLSDLDQEIPLGIDSVPVYEGGPVERHQLILARMLAIGEGAGLEALGRDEVTGAFPRGELRAFVGYAGWTSGQLEREIAERAWAVLPPSPDLLGAVSTPEEGAIQWRGIMRHLGGWNHLMSGAPDDLSLN